MSYKKFVSDIKADNLGSLIFLYGSENLLIRWCMNEIISKYAGDEEDRVNNLLDVAGESANIDELIGRAKTPSMFPGKRIIVIRNLPMVFKKTADGILNQEGQRLLDFANVSDLDAHIVIMLDSEHYDSITAYGKKLIKAADSYDCERLTLPELRGFINKRIKAAGKYIGAKQLEHLIDLTGYMNKESEYTLDELENDLGKLVNATDDTDISNELIEEIMVKEVDLFVFNFIDALVSKNQRVAMEMILNILDKEDSNAMQLTALLTSQFEMMYDARQLEKRGDSIKEMAKKLGVNEYRFKKAFKAATRFSEDQLTVTLTNLYEIDRLIKSGDMDKDLALQTFVLSV